MSVEDLHQAIARNIAAAIPGIPDDIYLRAAKSTAVMWRDEFTKGYRQGKEAGLMESTHGGEIATLRERLGRLENREPCPDPTAHSKEQGA